MKLLKKISLVYTLQIFAVIFLFFYADSSSANKANEPVTNIALPRLIKKHDFLNLDKDSLVAGETSFLLKSHQVKKGNSKK